MFSIGADFGVFQSSRLVPLLVECYIVDFALKIRLEEEQLQLQRSIAWLTTECDLLLQYDQALELFDCSRGVIALNDGIFEVFNAGEKPVSRMVEPN